MPLPPDAHFWIMKQTEKGSFEHRSRKRETDNRVCALSVLVCQAVFFRKTDVESITAHFIGFASPRN